MVASDSHPCQICLPTTTTSKSKKKDKNEKDGAQAPEPPKLDDEGQRKLNMYPGPHFCPTSSCHPQPWPGRYKEKAIRIVRTHVLLIPEEKNSATMETALKSTAVPSWSGEVTHLASEPLRSNCFRHHVRRCFTGSLASLLQPRSVLKKSVCIYFVPQISWSYSWLRMPRVL